MASRNGLNPKIRGPKGVGYGRALPAPFDFGNGITPNQLISGSFIPGGYLNVPKLIDLAIPNLWTIEFWTKPSAPPDRIEGFIQYNDNHPTGSGEGDGAESRMQINPPDDGPFFQLIMQSDVISAGINLPTPTYNQRNHYVVTIDTTQSSEIGVHGVINGNVAGRSTGAVVLTSAPYTATFALFNLFALTTQSLFTTLPFDEFRMYNKLLTDQEITTNYNGGVGNNPSITENLFIWYNFERFETLDFSALQDGSNIQTGIRDMSGKNNHGLASGGLITDPSDPAYCIQPF